MAMSGRKVNPQSLTAIVIGVCLNGWVVFCLELYYFFSGHPRFKVNTLVFILLAFIFAGVANEFYSRNDRYLEVYRKYAISDQVRKRKNPILQSWLFIFLPYILLLLSLLRYA